MDEEKKGQLIVEVITTILILIFYWVSMQPEWKLEMYLRQISARLAPVKRASLSLEHQAIIRKFRQEISEWEHRTQNDGR